MFHTQNYLQRLKELTVALLIVQQPVLFKSFYLMIISSYTAVFVKLFPVSSAILSN